ncbi:Lacal_2735 family protein [Fulvivirga maritima]|uniref:Lacal_2735 family protein n=1 Tax=Fulvivirga maritima TaxID=2904247 RepID=UPI00351EF24E
MCSVFSKKKSKVEKLEIQYKKLLEESYKLSHSNRKESDKKRAEAEEILNQIESLTKND